MKNRRIRKFQSLEVRRLLIGDIAPLSFGSAPMDQVAAHVQLDATLGNFGGNSVGTSDHMIDQLFDAPSRHGSFSTVDVARSTMIHSL